MYVHEVLVNRLGGLSLPRKSVVRLSDRPDMTLDVYRGRKTTIQQHSKSSHLNIDPKSYAKYQNPSSSGSQDIMLTRFFYCYNGRVKGA